MGLQQGIRGPLGSVMVFMGVRQMLFEFKIFLGKMKSNKNALII